jgi:hypothetical protein
MADLFEDYAAFRRMRGELERGQLGKWVLIHDGTLVGIYDGMEAATIDAATRFGDGPFLIRQVGDGLRKVVRRTEPFTR